MRNARILNQVTILVSNTVGKIIRVSIYFIDIYLSIPRVFGPDNVARHSFGFIE